MVAKILYRTLATDLGNAIESPANRIRNQARGKRGRIAKAKATPLLELKNWIQEVTGNLEQLEVRYPNVDPP